MIMWAAIGSLLSTALPGCARQHVETLAGAPPAVVVKDTPAADLLACPAAPAGFPANASATIPAAVRTAAMALAVAYAGLSLQLVRLINWHQPGACAVAP